MAIRSEGQNRLAFETSPYLLQHANNPVDWYPWGDEAFARAHNEQLPVLLSVGYSTCHWCHVMAHESFEDPEIAALMNQHFVNIKVDREERPDVDSVYMTFTQSMTGQGGWPMTVFLTPDGEPFYAGTYFPPVDGHGRPSFRRLLLSVQHAWESDRERVLESAHGLTERVRESVRASEQIDPEQAGTLDLAEIAERVEASGDREHGGLAGAPKFPNPPLHEFMLAQHATGGDTPGDPESRTLAFTLRTLRAMSEGGIYDHLGGGFARYSVDAEWTVPHFEKMLYDNAQLVRLYLHAFQVTSDDSLADVARDTLAYLVREMRAPSGGFYSAQDADSEGIEGKYFVWTADEVAEVVGAADAPLALDLLGVTARGNFVDPHHPELTGRNVLTRRRQVLDVARERGLDADALEGRLQSWRAALWQEREHRIHPSRDDKILASWNGLALSAFATAARVLGDSHALEVARTNRDFVRRELWDGDLLQHVFSGGRGHVRGLLEDYAYYGLGLLDLYRVTGDAEDLRFARVLFERALDRFSDPTAPGAGFFETDAGAEALVLRQRPYFDAATPSGNGAMAQLAFWMGRYFGRDDWLEVARQVVGGARHLIERAPGGTGSLLLAQALISAPHVEVAIVGPPEERSSLEQELARHFLPATVIASARLDSVEDAAPLPLFEHRGGPLPRAFVCEDMVCGLPATSAPQLAEQLARAGIGRP